MPLTLHYDSLQARGAAAPTRWFIALHGIMGQGRNLRSIAQQVCEAAPTWGALLVDLRNHGASPDAAPPHTLAECARDVLRTLEAFPGKVEAVIGHSFGGKVALKMTALHALKAAVILDAAPSARSLSELRSEVPAVIDALEDVRFPLESREALVAALAAQGIASPIGRWLGANLRPADGGLVLRLKPAVIRDMLTRYYEDDLWHLLEAPQVTQLSYLVAGRALTFHDRELDRIRGLGDKVEALTVNYLPDASHWVHVDDPAATVQTVVQALQTV